MIRMISRLAIAAIVGSIASLLSFVALMAAISFLYAGPFPLGGVLYTTFFVFFFAGLPILGVAACGGIPLFLLVRNRPPNVARAIFFISGIIAGAIAVFIKWDLSWNTPDIFLGLAGAGVGLVGSYTFWLVAGGVRPHSES